MRTKWFRVGVAILVILGIVFLWLGEKPKTTNITQITSFEGCKEAGYPIMEIYPEQCRTPDGRMFTRVIEGDVEHETEKPVPIPVAANSKFDAEVTLRINGRAAFVDGLVVDVLEINDSRCKPDVQCIWAGEISTLLKVSGGSQGATPKEIRLGTTNGKSVNLTGYMITLQGASTADITIVVTKDTTITDEAVIPGYVAGTVSIGPMCPMNRVGHECTTLPEAYTSRDVVVFEADQTTIQTRRALNVDGTYSIALPQGTYWLQIQPAGIGEGEKKQVLVTARNTSTVDFDIDTGIR